MHALLKARAKDFLLFTCVLLIMCPWCDEAGAATFTVTTVENTGVGSLSAAVADANNSPGQDRIIFSIGSGPQTLTPSNGVVIFDEVTIDATTQPGFQGIPIIELSGINASVGHVGFDLRAPNCVIKGFIINAFFDGIQIQSASSNNVVQGNFIGTDATGTHAVKNRADGITILNSPGNVIGGPGALRNVISGNGDAGIYIRSPRAVSNVVQGNYIGTDASGANSLGNSGEGILMTRFTTEANPSRNIIGGMIPGTGNVISGNKLAGIYLVGDNNIVSGNLIGIDATGNQNLGNAETGIIIFNGANNTIGGTNSGARNVISGNIRGITIFGEEAVGNLVQGNRIGTDVSGRIALGNTNGGVSISRDSVGLTASNNRIGGTTPEERNIISGNIGVGVRIFGDSGGIGNWIQGNFIGIDVTGTNRLGNGNHGILLTNASDNLIGGAELGAGNVISGNTLSGIKISGGSSNLIQANLIGTTVDRTNALGNQIHGILITDSASDNLIGGYGNTIAFNGANGVAIVSGTGNGIFPNSIFGNKQIGIDLENDGPSVNDNLDADSGANNGQNSPHISSVDATEQGLIITGELRSKPNTTYTLDFYATDAIQTTNASSSSVLAQGKRYLGDESVQTDSSGHIGFTNELLFVELQGDEFVTATATDPQNNTSELYGCPCVRDHPAIRRPSPHRLINVNGWSMDVEVSDDDGLVLKDVYLERRQMAKQMSLPYCILWTSVFSNRFELKPDSDDASGRARLVDFKEEFLTQEEDPERPYSIQATYYVDKIGESCLKVVQQYLFYPLIPGKAFEPSGLLAEHFGLTSFGWVGQQFKPLVKYEFCGAKDEFFVAFISPQRLHLQVDQWTSSYSALIRDEFGFQPHFHFVTVPYLNQNPLTNEVQVQAIWTGIESDTVHNLHFSWNDHIDLPLTDEGSPIESRHLFGCYECVHIHWRWNLPPIPPLPWPFDGSLLIPRKGLRDSRGQEYRYDSVQSVNVALVRYIAGEEDPIDFSSLINPTNVIAGQDQVFWYVGTGTQVKDEFFIHGGAFAPRVPPNTLNLQYYPDLTQRQASEQKLRAQNSAPYVKFSVVGIPFRSYTVESSVDLVSWVTVTNFLSTAPRSEVEIPSSDAVQFYRVFYIE